MWWILIPILVFLAIALISHRIDQERKKELKEDIVKKRL